MLAFQVGAGDIVEEKGRGRPAAGEVVAPQGFFDLVLAGTQIVEGFIEVIFNKIIETEDLGKGVIAHPADGGEVGERAVFDRSRLAKGFAKKDGWGRGALGDRHHVHNCSIITISQYLQGQSPLFYDYTEKRGKIRPSWRTERR